MKKGVIQIIDSLNVGGAEMVAINIANQLAKNKHLASYLCTTRKEGSLKQQINNDVGYLYLDRKEIVDIKAIRKLSKFIKKNNIQIIHSHSSSVYISGFIKLLNPKIKIIWHDHYGRGDHLENRPYFFLKMFSVFISVIVSVNSELLNWSKRKLFTTRYELLNNFSTFNDLRKLTELKGVKGTRLVCVAGLRPQKDHVTLIKAFHLVQAKIPEATLHIIGKDYEDEYAIEILSLINELKLKRKVYLYGLKTDIKHILEQADIGILTSKSEGFALAILEYALAKKPIISTEVGNVRKLINDDRVISKVANFSELSKKTITLLEDNNLRNEIAEKLNKNVVNNYSEKVYIKRLIDIYNSL